ncbi:MAG: S-adenosylmethionine:tRNA ribosyltransferase-isomerase [Dysgonamonadaceae bacterium]|jgi:S-adenosylmethionine:tRNA ribosyltransferase-isomerase|nr:S-adenosylmethionine:tRNA ribosyltransferase-isomerase [Dysgonamonadaceae bacterium]
MRKNDIKNLRISDFSYELPDERIAKYPLTERDASKLLLYRNGEISDNNFRDLTNFIPSGSLLLFNNTRVIHARLLFQKETGAHIEIFCLSPNEPMDYVVNFGQRERCSWHCMVGNAKRWKNEPLTMDICIENNPITLTAKKIAKLDDETIVEFSWNNAGYTFSELLEIVGKLPIPPYLNRESEEKDDETYQTVYSSVDGSVAAPTAGLHFTENTMQKLTENGIKTINVTLHVGAGTFKPVKSETIAGHDMHTEFISVPKSTIETLLNNNGQLIVVGTTSMRTVESLYYIGRKLHNNSNISTHELTVQQWEPYEVRESISPKQALQNILDYLEKTKQEHLISSTQIIITPGYEFHFCDAIITNFHQPESTLLLLISAFVGDDWRKIYEFALENDFRFLSYGDSSLLFKNNVLIKTSES